MDIFPGFQTMAHVKESTGLFLIISTYEKAFQLPVVAMTNSITRWFCSGFQNYPLDKVYQVMHVRI